MAAGNMLRSSVSPAWTRAGASVAHTSGKVSRRSPGSASPLPLTGLKVTTAARAGRR
jgi:hypothetical protein